jgi:1-phosphofructokinase family hexose kinase
MTVRLLVAGPNLTIDRTAPIDELEPGGVLRTGAVAVTPGGKGVNVVRTALRLGAEATLVGFVAGRIGDAAAGMLADEGVPLRAIAVSGELRSTAILHESSGRTTVINEPGPTIDDAHWHAYETAVEEALGAVGVLVCSGSVPPGTPEDGYARLVHAARARGVLTVVDTSGPQLAAAVAAGPDLVAPNLAEAEALLAGRTDEQVDAGDDSAPRALAAAARLVLGGARVATVTAAAAGVAVAWPGGHRWVTAPRVAVRNPIGAGDSFTAAAALALASGHDPVAVAVAGVAAGAASVERALAGDLDPRRAAELRAAFGNPHPQ